jgi:hypothetical protein
MKVLGEMVHFVGSGYCNFQPEKAQASQDLSLIYPLDA